MMRAMLLVSGVAAMVSQEALDDKVEQAKQRWAEIRKRTQSMLDKVHGDMEHNIKAMEEDRQKQNALLKANMKSIDELLRKDEALNKQLHNTSPIQASFLELEQPNFNQKSAAEEEAARRTKALLKQLDEIAHGGSHPAAFLQEGTTVEEEPAVKALRAAQQKMQALQEKLHRQAMTFSLNQ
jgi:hypothetical protein